MENDKIEVDGQATPVVKLDDDINTFESNDKDPNLNFDKQKAREESEKERVEIEEPVERKFTISLSMLNIILSVVAITLGVLVRLFAMNGWGVVVLVFYWLAVIALIATLAIYIVQLIKDKKVAFDPSFVLLILAILITAVI